MSGPKIISLFTGAGGIDYGFEAAGFDTAVALEMDSICCKTLRKNRSWPIIENDILITPTSKILAEAGLSGLVPLMPSWAVPRVLRGRRQVTGREGTRVGSMIRSPRRSAPTCG